METFPEGRLGVPIDGVQPDHQSIVLEDGAKLCNYCSQIPSQFWVTEPDGGEETITATLQPLRTIRETAERKGCRLCFFLHARHRSSVWTDTVDGHDVSVDDLSDTQEGKHRKRRKKLSGGIDERFELTCHYGSVSSARFYLYKAPSWWRK